MCELFCMQLYEYCWRHVVVLSHHSGLHTCPLPTCDVIPFVCSFHAMYYYRLLSDTLHFPLYVLQPLWIPLDSLQGHTLASDKVFILTYARYCGQEITLLPTVGTLTPNGLRSSWEFLPWISPNMLAGPAPSTFLVLEEGLDDKMSPQSLFWISAHLSSPTLQSQLRHVFLMHMILKIRRMSSMTFHDSSTTVKVE